MTTPADQSTIEAIEQEASQFAQPTRSPILDGFACCVCGREGGAMTPAGEGPRGQVFAHVGSACNDYTAAELAEIQRLEDLEIEERERQKRAECRQECADELQDAVCSTSSAA